MRANRPDPQHPLLYASNPAKLGPRLEPAGKGCQHVDRELARKPVRPADETDEKSRRHVSGGREEGNWSKPRTIRDSCGLLRRRARQSRTRIDTFLPRALAAAPAKARRARIVRPSRPMSRPRSPGGTAIS